MQRHFVSLSLLVFLFSVGSSPGLQASSFYQEQTLGALGSNAADVSAFNSSGTAVGFYIDPTGTETAVRLDGSMASLGSNAAAYGINDAGTIVGVTYSGYSQNVTTWSGSTASVSNIAGYGVAINNAGVIVGGYDSGSGNTHAFALASGTMQDLGTLGGTWSTAYSVNNSGQIAGTSTLANDHFGAFLTAGRGLTSLGTLGGNDSYGVALSDNGMVAGSSETADGYLHAFRWNATTGMLDLGTLGGSVSNAEGVNDAGSVVGTSLDSSGAAHGFLYENGTLLDLNNLLTPGSTWTVTDASAINDAGQILATATDGAQNWAVELTAVPDTNVAATPEATTGLMSATGLLLCIGSVIGRRKRRLS